MLIPTYTTPVPAFDLVNELNNIINQINTNFQQNSVQDNLYTANTATAATTLTAASVAQPGVTDFTVNMTGTLAAGAALTLPTVASMLQQLPQGGAGTSWRLCIINSSSANFAWTVTTNTGWTLTGTMTIAQNTWRDFYVNLTSATAATLQAIGTGTQS